MTFREFKKKGFLYLDLEGDFETPVSIFSRWKEEPYAFLFESVEGGERWGRYSFIGLFPTAVVRVEEKKVNQPLNQIKKLLTPDLGTDLQLPPFEGGAVGYVAYEAVRFFEKISFPKKKIVIPDFCFFVPSILLVFDNLKHSLRIYYFPASGDRSQKSYQKGCAELKRVSLKLKKMPKQSRRSRQKAFRWNASMGRAEFEKKVRRVKEYIFAGDVTQAVLSIRFSAAWKGDPFEVYRRLRELNPSPYLFYLRLGEFQIVGASPETMVRLQGREATLRPIAGTRKRGKTAAEDQKLAEELLRDPKERAEHIMLVDLARNDLGRVAEPGSVKVDQLMKVEKYSHVMHMVSNVRASLRADRDAFGLLEATFPAGTLTGSPKVRAMQIIDELEPIQRGLYGGCVGYFSNNGNMDMAIAIRSAFFYKGEVSVQAGAGIVADSVPAREYEECLNKAQAIMVAVEGK